MSIDELRKKPRTEKHWIRFWQDWKAIEDSYPEKGLMEKEEILGKMYGVSRKTVTRWKKEHPPVVEIYTKAEEFMKIPYVKEWYDTMMELDPARKTHLRSSFRSAKECWEANDKIDPRLWNEDSIKRCIKSWREKGLKEKSVKIHIIGVRKFLMEVKQAKLNELFNREKKRTLKVGAIATRRGTEEIVHQPLTKEQFLSFREKMDEACKEYYEDHTEKFPSSEWLCKLMEAENYLAVFSGIRTGDAKLGNDMLGLRVVTDPANIPKIISRRGTFDCGYVLYDAKEKKILRWNVLAKWYLRWTKIRLPAQVTKLIEEWIEYAELKHGDYLFPIQKHDYRDTFKIASKKCNFPFLFVRHNLRSTNLLWQCESDIPLEVAIELGVGWDTIETARKFYLSIKKRKEEEEFQKLIRYSEEVMPT